MVDKCCQTGSSVQKNLRELKKDLQILNDENRLRILCLLKGHDELCVCDIYEALGLPQNLVSYHLRKLKSAGFLGSRKKGAKVLYCQGKKQVGKFQELIKIIV